MEPDMISTDDTATRSGRPRLAAAAIAAAGLAALAGCSSAAPSAAGSASPSGSVSATASTAPVTPASSPAATPTSVSEVSASDSPVPVLGQLTGVFAHGKGFGQVRPAEVDNGGDPTGLVTGITWKSWGGATATGTGTGSWDPPGQPVAASLPQPATIVAFNLGTCDGKLMYQAVEWYFPQHGQAFNPAMYENVCTGSYVPGS
jgi:hypothetical protein